MSYINDFLLQSVYLLPEPANYAAGVVSDAYREEFGAQFPPNKLFPQQSEESYRNFWLQDTPLTTQQKLVLDRIKDKPLPDHFKTVQEQYSIGNLKTPPAGATPQQALIHKMLVRGEQAFAGAQTVGDLQKVLASDAVRSMIMLEKERFGGGLENFGQQVGSMTQSLFERVFPRYEPSGGDWQTSKKLRSFMNFAISGMFSGIKTEQRAASASALDLTSISDVTSMQPYAGPRQEGGGAPDPRTPYIGIKNLTPDEQLLEMRRQVFQRADFNIPTGYYVDQAGRLTRTAGRQLTYGNLYGGQQPTSVSANSPLYMSAKEAMFLTGNVSSREKLAFPEYTRYLPSQVPLNERGDPNYALDPYANRRAVATSSAQNLLHKMNDLMGITGDPSMSKPHPLDRWAAWEYDRENEALIGHQRRTSQMYYENINQPRVTQLALPGFGRKDALMPRTPPQNIIRGIVTEPYEYYRKSTANYPIFEGQQQPRAFQIFQGQGWSMRRELDAGDPFYRSWGKLRYEAGPGGTPVVTSGMETLPQGRRVVLEGLTEQPFEPVVETQRPLRPTQYEERTYEQLSYLDPASGAMAGTTGTGISFQKRMRQNDVFNIAGRIYSRGMTVVHQAASRLAASTAPASVAQQMTESMAAEFGGDVPASDVVGEPRGTQFGARQLVQTGRMPVGMMPYEQAFEGATGRGRATGNVGYLRATDPSGRPFEYIDEVELAKQYTGVEKLQKTYMVRKLAGFHELGHVVFKHMPAEVQKEFLKVYSTRLEQVGKNMMLAADWPKESFSFREEFAQAYAVAAGVGGEELLEKFPEYADFFRKFEDQIEVGEKAATLVEHFGDVPQASVPRRQTQQVLGDIPRQMQSQYKPYGYLKGYLSDVAGSGAARRQTYLEMVSQLRTAAETGMPLSARINPAQGGADQQAWKEAGLIAGYDVSSWQRGGEGDQWSAQVSASSETRQQRHTRYMEDISAANDTIRRTNTANRAEANRQQRIASGEIAPTPRSQTQQDFEYRNQPGIRNPDQLLARINQMAQTDDRPRTSTNIYDANVVGGTYQGQTQVLTPEQTQQAMERGVNAVLSSTGQRGSGSVAETYATVLSRFNKAILDTYDKALSKDMPTSERQIVETQRQISQAHGRQILNRAGRALSPTEMGEARALSQGFRVQIGPDNVDAFMRSNPDLQQQFAEEGVNARELARGAQGTIRATSRGPVQFGGGGGMMGGGGMRPPGQGGQPRLNLFGGGAGALMYAAYITKRMWSMTAAPEFQAAEQYGQDLGEMSGLQHVLMGQQYGPMAGPPLTSTDVGAAVRQTAVGSYMARGAFEQFGGITDAAYSFTGGSGAGPRAMSGLKVAAGIATGGLIAGQTLGFMGAFGTSMNVAGAATMGAIGSAISTAAIPVAVGAGATVGLMELYNSVAQPAVPVSVGGVFRDATRDWHRTNAAQALSITQTGSPLTTKERLATLLSGAPSIFGEPRYTDEELMTQMTPQQRAIVNYQGMPQITQDTKEQLRAVKEATGEEGAGIYTAFSKVVQGLGRVPTGFADTARQWAEMGLSVEEGTNAFMQMADRMGYVPGTPGYESFWGSFNATMAENDITKFHDMKARADRVAQFSGQIAPYFQSSSVAERLTDEYGLTTAGQMGPVQSLMGIASRAGIDMDQVMGYNVTGYEQSSLHISPGVTRSSGRRQVMEPYTMADIIMDQSQRRGNFLTYNVDAPLASALLKMGTGGREAVTAAERMGFTTAQQVQSAQRWMDTAATYGYTGDGQRLIEEIPNISAFAAAAIPRIAEPMMLGGVTNAMEALAQGMGQNLSDAQIGLVGAGMGGDMGAMSWMANNEPGLLANPEAWQFRDQAGRPIFQSNMPAFLNLTQNRMGQLFNRGLVPQGSMIEGPLQALSALPPGTSALRQTQAFLGGTGIDDEMMRAFSISGRSASALHQSRMAGYQRQQAGIAMAGVALSRNMLWGGGDFRNPTPDSIWGIQDRQRAAQHRQQMYQFSFNREMMETQNQFAVRQEAISGERMEVGQAFQRWQFGFQQQGMMQQRGFARQDWQFQDTMRNMGFGWAMEDMDEAIRTSTGRQRSRMVRQRDRMTTKFNLEGQQIETQRERQEEAWAREDERFEKQQDYAERTMELDEEQFELQQEQRETLFEMQSEHLEKQLEFYKENKTLQDEMIAKQREYQAAQLDLQAASAAVQAKMAEEQETFNKAVALTEETFGLIEDSTKQIMTYEPEKTFAAFSDMVIEMDKLEIGEISTMSRMWSEMSRVDNTASLISLFNTVARIDPARINKLINALLRLEAEARYGPGP